MIKVVIISFSFGLDSATINVIDTNAELDNLVLQSEYRMLFFAKKVINKDAAILLQPSAKG